MFPYLEFPLVERRGAWGHCGGGEGQRTGLGRKLGRTKLQGGMLQLLKAILSGGSQRITPSLPIIPLASINLENVSAWPCWSLARQTSGSSEVAPERPPNGSLPTLCISQQVLSFLETTPFLGRVGSIRG